MLSSLWYKVFGKMIYMLAINSTLTLKYFLSFLPTHGIINAKSASNHLCLIKGFKHSLNLHMNTFGNNIFIIVHYNMFFSLAFYIR